MNAHGKLLLTGEYAVLDGASAFAIPLIHGQSMKVSGGRGCDIVWEAYENDERWFKARISLFDFKALKTSDESISDNLSKLLSAACSLNSDFLSTWKGMKVKTNIDFPREYGWGTSSTLIELVARWADVDPYDLMRATSNGSGYDIACASADGPILYQWIDNRPSIQKLDWTPEYIDKLYLIYQGQKQDSTDAITLYRKKASSEMWLQQVNDLSLEFIKANDLQTLESVILDHEKLIGNRLNLVPIKERRFPDYWGMVKSLGAWGGDFALVSSLRGAEETKKYFADKGLKGFMPLESVILSGSTAEV